MWKCLYYRLFNPSKSKECYLLLKIAQLKIAVKNTVLVALILVKRKNVSKRSIRELMGVLDSYHEVTKVMNVAEIKNDVKAMFIHSKTMVNHNDELQAIVVEMYKTGDKE